MAAVAFRVVLATAAREAARVAERLSRVDAAFVVGRIAGLADVVDALLGTALHIVLAAAADEVIAADRRSLVVTPVVIRWVARLACPAGNALAAVALVVVCTAITAEVGQADGLRVFAAVV